MIATRTKVKPPSSSSVTYSVADGNVLVAKIGWTRTTNAWPNSYDVLYRDDAEIATSLTATAYRDTGVIEGGQYNYTLATVNVHEIESVAGASVNIDMPSFPVWDSGWSLSIVQNDTDSVATRCSDPDGGALTFSKISGPSTVFVASGGEVSVGATTAADYILGIRANNGFLDADFSVSLTVAIAQTAPDAPVNVIATEISSTEAALSWERAPTGSEPTDYDIRYATTLGGATTDVPHSGTSTSASITGLSAGDYYFEVRAGIDADVSAWTQADPYPITLADSGTADFVIPAITQTITFNGSSTSHPNVNGPNRAVQAGDIIELEAGTHGRRHFDNVIGTSGNRVTIRNGSGGQVIIRSSTTLSSGFTNTFNNCRYVDFVGNNSSLAQTHPIYTTERIGFKFMYASQATTSNKDSPTAFVKFQALNSTTVTTDNIKMSNFEIDGGWNQVASSALSDGGIGLQTQDQKVLRSNNSGEFQENIELAYFVLRNCNGEGGYLGPNFANGTIPMKNIEVHHFYTDMTGGDGINGKCWFEGTNSIHDGTIERACRDSTPAGTPGCCSIISGKADVYNVIVEDGGSASGPNGNGTGIKFFVQNGPTANTTFDGYGPYGAFDVEVYNCITARNNNHGVSAAGQSGLVPYRAKFYNDTSVDNLGTGLNTGGTTLSGGFIKNCISVGNGNNISASGGTSASSNQTTGTSASLLVDPDNGNYELQAANLASGTIGVDIAPTDIDGDIRSAGSADKGAQEF